MRILQLLVFSIGLSVAATPALADDRADAKAHYQAGVKAYSSSDYRTAIREFSAAQQLLPADLNNYNLALCYDKLGEAGPAIQYYRSYLDRVPATDKRGEIEASVARLEAAQRSMDGKKQDEQRRADEAARAEQARIENQRRADEQARLDQARRDDEARRNQQPPINGGGSPPIGGGTPYNPNNPNNGTGATGTPGTGTTATTGDAQLDRVQGIDVNSIRTQRGAGGPAVAADPNNPNGNPQPNGVGTQTPTGPQVTGTDQQPAAPETPVYKKWWFWAVVAVSAYVVYEIANNDSSASGTARTRETLPLGPVGQQANGGMTLLHW